MRHAGPRVPRGPARRRPARVARFYVARFAEPALRGRGLGARFSASSVEGGYGEKGAGGGARRSSLLCPSVSPMGRWDPAKKRKNHARLRLQELKKAFPHLTEDALLHATLRQLSQAARRAGLNQTALPREESPGATGASKQLETWSAPSSKGKSQCTTPGNCESCFAPTAADAEEPPQHRAP